MREQQEQWRLLYFSACIEAVRFFGPSARPPPRRRKAKKNTGSERLSSAARHVALPVAPLHKTTDRKRSPRHKQADLARQFRGQDSRGRAKAEATAALSRPATAHLCPGPRCELCRCLGHFTLSVHHEKPTMRTGTLHVGQAGKE